jgi:hypothetical protein
MTNYSFIQRLLHRGILSTQLMREVMFDIEKFIFFENDLNIKNNHIFISGLARSGTTVLLNAIYKSNQFASITYDDMPFILAPNFWAKLSPKKNHKVLLERAHGDGIKIHTNSPEAFEEVFWNTFDKDLSFQKDLFIKFISLILKKNNKTRYLSKNNQNIRRLDLISKFCPDSKILISFRDPLQQSFSLFSQHKKFKILQKKDSFTRDYMKLIGHSEFGLDYEMINTNNLQYSNANNFNHWLEQWYLTYKSVLDFSEKHQMCYLISYELLCSEEKVWLNLKDLLDIQEESKFIFKENRKDIELIFDDKLYLKCFKLYELLLVKSFSR